MFKGLVFILLFTAIFNVAVLLDAYFFDYNLTKGVVAKDILFKALGSFKETVGAMVWLKADEYYHGGIAGPANEKHLEEGRAYARENQLAELEHKHEAGAISGGKFNWADFIGLINYYVQVTEHKHLTDTTDKEIVPWFELATDLDPHNVQAYIVGAYWVGERLEKPDQGLKFLEKGRINNPDNWQIYEEFGNIYFRIKQDYARAARHYRLSYEQMNVDNSTLIDRKRVLTFLGASFERTEDYIAAIKYFKILDDISGNDEKIRQRINKLEGLIRVK